MELVHHSIEPPLRAGSALAQLAVLVLGLRISSISFLGHLLDSFVETMANVSSMAGHIATAKRQDWCTPLEIIEAVRGTFGGSIDLDPCSNQASIVGASMAHDAESDGLSRPWRGNVYVNPPYGRGLKVWVRKCAYEFTSGNNVIALIPAAVETKHWHEFVFKMASRVCFLKGRVKFINPDTGEPSETSAPMPVAAILWSDRNHVQLSFDRSFEELGMVVHL